MNQRTQQVFNAGSTYNYTYDPIGQLKVADSGTASEDRGYQYDSAWNLNRRTNNTAVTTFTVNSLNEATKVGTADYHYDGNGNRVDIREDLPWYAYDDENRLIVVENDGNGWRTEFSYDGTGRLRQRLEYTGSPGSWTLASTTRYLYDGWRVIQERNASNVPQVSYTRGTDLSGTLEGAGGIGGLLGRSHGYSFGNWSTHNFYHADGNGNVTYLVNSSQTKAAAYRYDPFGSTVSSSGSLASANVYRFSSKELHVNSGLYYYGYRFYDPNTQTWPNRDPIQEWGGINLYRFVLNDPMTLFDPLGLDNQAGREWPQILTLPDGRIIVFQPPGNSGGAASGGNRPPANPILLPPGITCSSKENGDPVFIGPRLPTAPHSSPPFFPPLFPTIPPIPCSTCKVNLPPPVVII